MHRTFRLAALAALFGTLVAGSSLAAQSSLAHVQLPSGVRVRVTAPTVLPEPVVGRVVARTDEGLMISRNEGRVQITFSPEQIQLLEVSEGRNRGQWALMGGLGGMAAGALIGGWQGGRNDPSGFGGALGFIAGGITGLFAGAIGGGLLAPERWERHLFSSTR